MRFTEVPEELIRRCQEGDSQAFNELYSLIDRDLYASIYYFLRNHEDTQDVIQLVLVRLFRHIKRLKDPKKFASWFWRLITNQCFSYRSKQRQKAMDTSYNDALEVKDEHYTAYSSNLRNPREVLINKEIMHQIEESVEKLPKRQRMCFVLFEIEGYALKDIAEILGTSIGAVKFNIHQARRKLREDLKEVWKAT